LAWITDCRALGFVVFLPLEAEDEVDAWALTRVRRRRIRGRSLMRDETENLDIFVDREGL
jgi:hypothetical protein